MPVSETEIVDLLQAIQYQHNTSNRSWVRWKAVANSNRGPDEVRKLREYQQLEEIENYLEEKVKVRLTPVGREAARKGSLKEEFGGRSERKPQSGQVKPGGMMSGNPFSDSWLSTSGSAPVDAAVISGHVPFSHNSIRKYLEKFGTEVWDIRGEYENPDLLVVGQKNHRKGAIPDFLAEQRGTPLRICSQEMLLSWIYTGYDPNQDRESVGQFIERHPTLKRIRELLEGKWPDTGNVPAVRGDGGSSLEMEVEESALKRLGYETGSTGKNAPERREILREAFNCPLGEFPGTYPADYFNDWGRAGSGRRLEQIAHLVAYHCRLFKQQQNPPEQAIEDREADLEWLKRNLYPPLTYTFDWPDT